MSFLVPKKPQILYAPMLASFGGGSARGFNPGGGPGGEFQATTYIARVTGVANELSSFPSSTGFMTRTWSHNGNNADGGTINVSGSGEYKLISISMGKKVGPGNTPTIFMKVYSGTVAESGALVSSQSITYPGFQDSTSPYEAQELVFPEPVTLDRGTTYAVCYGMNSPGLAVNSGAVDGTPDGKRTSYSIDSANGGGTLTFGDMTYNDSAPFGVTNGTTFVSSGNGQLPIFGFQFSA